MPDEAALPTVPPHILQQLKVIVEAVTGVPTDKIVLIATVHEVDGESHAHVGVELDGRALTKEEGTLLNEVLAEAISIGRKLDAMKAATPFSPAKILKEIQ